MLLSLVRVFTICLVIDLLKLIILGNGRQHLLGNGREAPLRFVQSDSAYIKGKADVCWAHRVTGLLVCGLSGGSNISTS